MPINQHCSSLCSWVISMNEQRLTNVFLKLLGVYCALKAVERFHGLVVVSITTDYFMWSRKPSHLSFMQFYTNPLLPSYKRKIFSF